jgi:hypothetical protein
VLMTRKKIVLQYNTATQLVGQACKQFRPQKGNLVRNGS